MFCLIWASDHLFTVNVNFLLKVQDGNIQNNGWSKQLNLALAFSCPESLYSYSSWHRCFFFNTVVWVKLWNLPLRFIQQVLKARRYNNYNYKRVIFRVSFLLCMWHNVWYTFKKNNLKMFKETITFNLKIDFQCEGRNTRHAPFLF